MIQTPEWLFADNIFFKTLFQNTVENTIIVIDKTGTIISVNDAFLNCFEYKFEQISGKKTNVLYTEADQQEGLPEKELYNVLSKGQGSDNNYLVSGNNTITWVSGESVLVKDNNGHEFIVKIIQNIHHIKQSEANLQNLNKFNEAILGAIKDVVVVLDENMNVVKANNSFVKLFMEERTQQMQVNFAQLISTYDTTGELVYNIEQAILSKNNFSNINVEIKTFDGEARVFDVNSSTLEPSNTRKEILLVLHDITLHKILERGREDLIGFVAHELRNPLGNLVLCNDLLGEYLNENKLADAIGVLQRSKNNVLRLNKMIAELYTATKINAGALSLEISAFNFGDMLREAIDSIEVLQPDYKIIVNGNANLFVEGDRYRLIEVITNYLSNGIKYSNGNTNVTITIVPDKEFITVSVKDEGLGISPAQLPYVFERYFRAEQTSNLEGIGLGLYLCRRIIIAHRGKVWVESKEGKGSNFCFSIPLKAEGV